MKINYRWATSIFIAAATLLRAGNAIADTAQEAAAEMRFQESKVLMEQGNFAAACPKLVESQRLDPAVGTLLYLGECYDRNGQTATAWATFVGAAEAAHSANQPDREKTARQRAETLFVRVSKLTITVASEAHVAGLEVKLDGAALGEASWGVATALDPGDHLIEAKAPNRKPWSSKIRIAPATPRATIAVPVLELIPVDARAVAPGQFYPLYDRDRLGSSVGGPFASRGAEANSSERDGSKQRLLAVAAGGVGVAGFAVATIFGLVAKSKESQSTQYCSPNDNTACNQKGVSLIDDAKHDAKIANVGLVVGGLGLVTGAVLYLTAPKSRANKGAMQTSRVQIAPLVAPTSTGLSVAGGF